MENPENLLGKVLDTKKLKYCYECGICTASCPMAELLPTLYNPRSLLQKIWFDYNKVLTEKEMWLCAWCYRCYKKCPQGLKLPEVFLSMKDLAAERGYFDGFMGALEIIRKEVPLPAACCYVCFHPGRGNVDKPPVVSILKRFLADHQQGKKEKKLLARKAYKEKIAIVGSGPAGLTAGYELVRKGYPVTIFESLPEPGGMLRVGIPEYRLPKGILDVEIEYIKDLGVDIRTHTIIGKDLSFNDLLKREKYKAIFIATGTHKSRKLRVEGEDMEGVVHALDLLRQANLKKRPKLGERVVVVGGGNVAMDAARTALRHGAEAVQVVCLESREEIPAHEWEIRETLAEGVVLNVSWGPKKILGDGKKVTGVEFVRCVSVFDENGRFNPSFDETVAKVLEADTVILAIGQVPDLSFLEKEIDVLDGGAIAVDPMTMETNLPGVFAGGDAVSGPATVIEAIVAGKRAAASIDRYLRTGGKSEVIGGINEGSK